MGCEGAEGQRVGVADGDQPAVGQHEGDGAGDRAAGFDRTQHGGGHIERAVFLVEPARRLDLAHLLLGGDVDAEGLVDAVEFLHRRVDHVDPDHGLVDRAAGGGAAEHTRFGDIEIDHAQGLAVLGRSRGLVPPAAPGLGAPIVSGK